MLKYALLLYVFSGLPSFAASPQCSAIFKETKSVNPEAIESGKRIKNYFSAVQEQMVEREYVVKALLNAMIAKEHLLMVGPPGNAKTTLTKLVFENIKEKSTGETSFFATQMTSETSLSDTHGGINYKTLQETGRQDRLYEEGILGARVAMLDEQFDMRPNGYRNILDVLAERAHAQGGKKHKGKTWTVVGASNTFIPDVYAKFDGNEQPRALIDRYAYVLFVPAEMEKNSSNRLIVQGSQKERKALPEIYFEDFENVQKLVSQVEIPNYISDLINLLHYRLRTVFESKEEASLQEYKEKVLAGEKPLPPYKSTKYLSPRTLGKAAGVVRASVAFDYVNNNGQRRLSVQVKDLEELVNFYSLGGPSDKFIQNQISRASKEVEKEQLKTILWERKVVRETLNNILAEYNQKLTGMGSQDLYAKVRDYQSLKPSEKRELMDMFRALYVRSREIANMDQDAINPELIAEVSIGELVPKWVNQINPEKAKDIIASWDKSAPISKKKNIQHRYQSVTEGNGSIKGLEKKAAPRDSNAADRPKDEGKSIQSASGSQTDGPSEQGKNIKFDPNYSAKIAELFKSNLRNFDQHNFKEYLEKGFDPKTHIGPGTVQPFTALTAAAWGGQTKTVKILLEHEADPTVISTGKASNGQLHTLDALGWAKEQGYPEIVKILEEHLAKKAHPEATKNSTTVPVDAAFTAQAVREQFNEKLVKQDQGVLKSYLDKGFDPNAIVYDQFQQKWTAIGLAANHGKYDQVAMLLEYGADPNRPSTYLGNSQGAIGWARKNGHEKVAKLIEDHLAKQAEQMPAVANRTASGNVIIDDAYTEKLIKETDFSEFFKATKDYQAMADILEYGFDPNAVVLRNDQKKVRWTALGLAAFYGNIEVIKALMDYGANPGIKSQYGAGEFAAHEVTRISGRHDVEKFIKEYKPTRPVSAKNPIERGRLRKYDKTYTDQAILDLSGQFMILDSRMDEFLSNGFDPNVTIYENKTNKFSALGMAISRAQVKSVKLLLEAGADPRIKNLVDSKVMDNMTLARQVGNPEIIKMLEEYKAKYSRYLEYPFPEKKLPKIGHTYTLTIISHELKGHHNTLETFDFYTYLEKGFDPNVILWKKDNEQFSALATAIYFSQYDLIKLLLAYGADATVVVNSRAGYAGAMSGLEFAKVHGDPKSIRIIESHLANLKSAQWGSASVKVPVDQAFTEAKSKVVYGGLNGSSNFEIREYLEKGFDPNGIVIRQGNKTWTAICNAAFNGKTEAVRTLLEFGADPTIKSDDFRAGRLSHDALEWAREKGHSKTAQVLEEYYKKHNLPI